MRHAAMSDFLDILKSYQWYGVIAFVVTVFATPLASRAARRLNVMDFPDQRLKPHARPIPYLGGAAICLGWLAAVLVGLIVQKTIDWHLALPIVVGGVLLSIMGLVDDIREIPPKVRLLIGTVVIAAVLGWTHTGFRLVDPAYFLAERVAGAEPGTYPIPDIVSIPISFVISVFIVLGACNSTNLIDGLDGLCSGVTAIISLGFFLLASHLAVWSYSTREGDPVRLLLSIAMVGAALGFLPMNFNPAKIFMGDAGSILLGYSCGMLILLFAERSIFRWVIGALMIFALPVFDTALALFRRWRSGRSIFAGDRSHFYDQLVQRGLTVRQSVLVCYLLTVFFAVLGLSVILIRTRYAIAVYLGVCLLVAVVAWKTGLTHPEEPAEMRAGADTHTDAAVTAEKGSNHDNNDLR